LEATISTFLSVLLSSLSIDVLHLVVNYDTSYCVWRTLEKALVSLSNSRIIQLHKSFQNLQQGDASVTMYMQQGKLLFDELATADWPISLEDFNLYVFRGLYGEFKLSNQPHDQGRTADICRPS
jgi:hypothetical protein